MQISKLLDGDKVDYKEMFYLMKGELEKENKNLKSRFHL